MRKNNNNVILIVDNNPDQIKQLGLSLRDLGDIIFATSGARAITVAEQRKPDLILSQLDLGSMTGIELCKQLKKQKSLSEIAIAIVTENSDEKCEVAALEAGAIDYVSHTSTRVLHARVKTHLVALHHKYQLQSLADKDGLTEVYSRRYFENQGRIEIKRHYRQQQPLTLALLDVDHFKTYNDAYGHLQGDHCLREIARAISNCTRRPGEFVARYGGEEFAVVLPNTNAHNAQKYGKWICEQILSLAIPHNESGTVPFITVSVGLATVVPSPQTTLEGIVTTADAALYTAKESGRNQFKLATIERETIREAG